MSTKTENPAMYHATISHVNNSIIISGNANENVTANNGGAILDSMILEVLRLAQSFTIRQRVAFLNAGYAIEDGNASA